MGHPAEIAERYGFAGLEASHCVGHTRMATESAVSPAHAHPFTAGEDFCLVHNGSLSNPWSLRRRLEKRGVDFETDNDTEAACRFLEWRMREGESLEEALKAAFVELDGFYTLLMATAEKLVLVRDAFACKPAVVAETEDYVAVSSEFRSLAHLPGIRVGGAVRAGAGGDLLMEPIALASVDLRKLSVRQLNHYLHHEIEPKALSRGRDPQPQRASQHRRGPGRAGAAWTSGATPAISWEA